MAAVQPKTVTDSAMPYARKGSSVTAAAPPPLRLLTPSIQSGNIDVSDLEGLDPVALRKELLERRYERLRAYGRFTDTKER